MNTSQLPIVVGIVMNEKEEVLVGKRGISPLIGVSEMWEYPGGKIDFGETPEAAIVREIQEETGLKVKVISLLPEIFTHVWENQDGSRLQVIIIVYKCEVVSGELNSKEPDKLRDLHFAAREELAEIQSKMLIPNRQWFKYIE